MGYRAFKELDWPLIIVTLILSGLGIIQVYSATNGTKWDGAWEKQIIWVITGLDHDVGHGRHWLSIA